MVTLLTSAPLFFWWSATIKVWTRHNSGSFLHHMHIKSTHLHNGALYFRLQIISFLRKKKLYFLIVHAFTCIDFESFPFISFVMPNITPYSLKSTFYFLFILQITGYPGNTICLNDWSCAWRNWRQSTLTIITQAIFNKSFYPNKELSIRHVTIATGPAHWSESNYQYTFGRKTG